MVSQTQPPIDSNGAMGGDPQVWVVSTGVLALMLVTGAVYGKFQWDKLQKQLRMETFRSRELKKRLDTSLAMLQKMERNPDLVHSREFNLDYLRMRMEEETFHFAIVNQIKMKIKMLVSLALRPTQKQAGAMKQGNAGTNRRVDHTFDVEYETNDGSKRKKRVLFRVQICLMKLPTQPTSKTIEEIIKCLEHYLSCSDDEVEDRWQPTLQGRIATISWDQKAKPTPLLVMNQSQEGMNVTMRSRMKDVTAAKRGRPDEQPQEQQRTATSGRTKGRVRQRTLDQATSGGGNVTNASRGTSASRGSNGGRSQGKTGARGKSGNTQVRRRR
ncbi:MAG: hypothetical protein AAF889_02400 [Cyanobacteria bacterium P01_D01_bin.73]